MDLIHEGQYFSVRGQFSSSVALTRFILLYGSVFKVTKHDLEAVRVQRVQHPKHNEKQKQRWHEIMLFVQRTTLQLKIILVTNNSDDQIKKKIATVYRLFNH